MSESRGLPLGSLLWEPDRQTLDEANLTAFLAWLADRRDLHLGSYGEFWDWSTTELEEFWSAIWDFYGVEASAEPSQVLGDRRMPTSDWFPGARLSYPQHVLDRAPQEGPAILALDETHEPRPISAAELRGQVGAIAAVLREAGVGRGDRVAAFAGNIPETVVAMLATTSLGAVWTVCAPDLGAKSVLDRFAQVEPTVLFAVDGYRFGGVDHERIETVREVRAALDSVRQTILIRKLWPDAEPPADLHAEVFDRLIADPVEPTFEQMDFGDPLWILYSSGTTGKPKGIVQSQGGILVEHLKSLGLGMDIREGDHYYFFSSTSWMAWNYLVGGLLHGATIVLYDGSPGYPDALGSWRVAAETAATTFGTGAAYVSACAKSDFDLGDLDLGALRTVIPTGSPLPPLGWEWLSRRLDQRVRIDPIAGGTDVCTCFIGGSPLLPVRLGRIPCRWPGVAVDILDGEGHSIVGAVGEFVVTQPMPSMPIGLWDDPSGERYLDTYFSQYPGVWRQGDWAEVNEAEEVTMLGRSDATLNRAGVRIGSAEIYASVEAHPEVSDSLVVGVELPEGEYWMPLFLVLTHDATLDDDLRDRIATALRSELSPRHVPDEIIVAPAVPRTLTGKKLEVPVKRVIQGVPVEEAAALDAIDDPTVLDWYAQVRQVFSSEVRA